MLREKKMRRMRMSMPMISWVTDFLVDTYRYLGVHLDKKLDWKVNTEAVYRKGMSRLYFLRKIRFFHVCSRYDVSSQCIFFAAVCRERCKK